MGSKLETRDQRWVLHHHEGKLLHIHLHLIPLGELFRCGEVGWPCYVALVVSDELITGKRETQLCATI